MMTHPDHDETEDIGYTGLFASQDKQVQARIAALRAAKLRKFADGQTANLSPTELDGLLPDRVTFPRKGAPRA